MHHINLIYANTLAWCSNKHLPNDSNTPLDVAVYERDDKEIILILHKYQKWKLIVESLPDKMKENIHEFNKPDKHFGSIFKHTNLETVDIFMSIYPDMSIIDDKISGINTNVYVKNLFSYCSTDCIDKFDYLLNKSILKDKLNNDQKKYMVRSLIEKITSYEDLERIHSLMNRSIILSRENINEFLSHNYKLSCDDKVKIIKYIRDKDFSIEKCKCDLDLGLNLDFTKWEECPKISKHILLSDKFKHITDKRFEGLSSLEDIKNKYKQIRKEKKEKEEKEELEEKSKVKLSNSDKNHLDGYDDYMYHHLGTSSYKRSDLKFCKFL
nr:hypothetical protein [Megavirus caiporensis]